MPHDIIKRQQSSVLSAISDVVNNLSLNNVVTEYNSKTGTASVSGNINNIQYTTTIKQLPDGVIQTNSAFEINTGKSVLANQIKSLRAQGYKQAEIAKMLNISQPTVSNYLKK